MDMLWVLFVLVFFLIFITLRRKAIKDRDYFEKQGIMYLGNRSYNLLYETIRGITIEQNVLNWYNLMVSKGLKVAGYIEFGAKAVTINDPELIKLITIKDFDHFVDRRIFEMPKEEKLFGRMLFALRGQTWKKFRTAISPAFTSGRIKRIYRLFEKSGDSFVKFLQKEIDQSDSETIEYNFIDGIAKFTIEIISTAVCGIQSKTFELKEPSIMELMSRRMELQFGPIQVFKLLITMLFPAVGNFFKMSFFDKESEEYFMWAIKQTIKVREENPNKNWDDFIQLMIEGRKGLLTKDEEDNNSKDKEQKTVEQQSNVENSVAYLDDEHIVANCVLFILAGYDTTQGALIFTLYSLALNSEIQDRLREEIERAVEEDKDIKDGEFMSYEMLHSLKYLDMVLSETLRMYPPTIMIDRGCNKDYQIPGTDFVLKEGQGVIIPILGFHRDERFFPNATKYDPERFSVENKSKINPHAYMPFGSGPRSCIGYRFALTEAKLGIAILVYNYLFEPSANTPIPMTYKNANVLKPENGKLNITRITRVRPANNTPTP